VWFWAAFGGAEARSAAGFSPGVQGILLTVLIFFSHGARSFSGETS